jgi:hypothetical protein
MIPNHASRNVQTSGVAATGEFQISIAHSAHIMKILRDQLYSDKKLAVLREYSANAWDANREAGNGDKPIKVILPTNLDPTLYIRDYGPGISHENMFAIYAQYGVSTKRGTDGQVGMLGIGSKSGFAYTDSFTVTTWQDGVQRIYAALLNNDEKGTLNLLDDSPSDEPNGTMIQIPVRPNDIPEFVTRAEKLFSNFKPRPDINITLPPEPVPEVVMQHGTITRGEGNWLAVMGCIAYEVDLDQLRGLNAHRGGAGTFLDQLDGYLYFNIGDVEIAASREGLEYNDKTKKVLIEKFIDLIDEFVKQTLDNIEAGDFSFWEKRCRAQVLNDLHIPVPGIMKEMTDDKVEFEDIKNFTITYGHKQTPIRHVHVNPRTRIIIRDEIRKIDGYSLTGFDYVVRQNKDLEPVPTIDEVKTELDEYIQKLKITGVPIINISSIPWHAKAKFNAKPIKPTNKKHQVKTFVLEEDKKHYSTPFSDCWKIEDITQTDKDVYVLIRKFKVLDDIDDTLPGTRFYGDYRTDRDMAKSLGFKMPKVYGYKSTEKEPAKLDKITGKPYSEWREEFHKEVFNNPRVKAVLEALDWVELVLRSSKRYYYQNTSSVDPKVLTKIFKELGKDHLLCDVFRKIMVSKRLLKRTKDQTIASVKQLRLLIKRGDDESPAKKMREELDKAYPMFELFEEGFKTILEDGHEDRWITYIQLVDRAKKGLNNERTITDSNGRGNHACVEGESPRSEEGGAELPKPEERHQEGGDGRGVGEDRGPLDSTGNGEGLVERQVHAHRELSDLLRAASA